MGMSIVNRDLYVAFFPHLQSIPIFFPDLNHRTFFFLFFFLFTLTMYSILHNYTVSYNTVLLLTTISLTALFYQQRIQI